MFNSISTNKMMRIISLCGISNFNKIVICVMHYIINVNFNSINGKRKCMFYRKLRHEKFGCEMHSHLLGRC